MNNYQLLQRNLQDLKLTQMSLKIDEYITKINEDKISIVDALCELTSREIEVKNFNATNAMVKVAGFPHLKEIKDFDFDFQPKINKQQFLDFESLRFLENNSNIILIGNPQEINDLATKNNINLDGAQIVNPATSADFSKYANDLYELRKNKGMTLDQAKELLKTNSRYFATMMVKEGDADGFVSGASHPTSDTLRPALQILKAAPGTKLVSAFFVMVLPDKEFGDDGVFIFADSGLNEYPDADALS